MRFEISLLRGINRAAEMIETLQKIFSISTDLEANLIFELDLELEFRKLLNWSF